MGRVLLGLAAALAVLIPLVALATRDRRARGDEAASAATDALRGVFVLAVFVLIVLAVVVVREL